MKRDFYEELIKWKNNKNKKPLMLLGARQVGKTYLIDEFCKNEYKNYISINLLERKDIIKIYQEDTNSDTKYLNLKTLLDYDLEQDNTILFIDEIQESEELISELKYMCEKHNNVNIICAGSLLGVKLKRSKISFPVGKVWIKTLYPMNFHEFLQACNQNSLIEQIENAFKDNKPLLTSIHEKAIFLYKKYLVCGGMPESTKSFIESEFDTTKYDKSILESIIISYFDDMQRYVKNESETIKIKKIYDSISTQLTNQSKKFQYSKIDKDARSRDYELALDWLLESNLILQSFQVSLPTIPLKAYSKDDFFKIFINDVGLLSVLSEIKPSDILLDNLGIFKGPLTENYVASELTSLGYSLYYWKNDATSEVDFLLYKDSKIIPLEVKAGDNTQSKSLDVYRETYNPEVSYRISTKNFGFNPKKKIKSIPIYALFCLKEDNN